MVSTDMSRPAVADVVHEWSQRPGRAVIFDFNGTLSDDEPILLAIFTELFAEHLGWQMTPEEYRSRLLGHSDREIVDMAVRQRRGEDPELVEELLALRRERYKEIVASRSPITDAAAGLVERLARDDIPMAIVTGAQREDVLAVLGSCSTGELINLLVTEEDVARGKPDPEGFLLGADLLGAEPEAILVFEDSIPGIRGALTAGMRCIAVTGDDPQPQVLAEGVAITRRLSIDLLEH